MKFRQQVNQTMVVKKIGETKRRVIKSEKKKTFEEYVFDQTYQSKRKKLREAKSTNFDHEIVEIDDDLVLEGDMDKEEYEIAQAIINAQEQVRKAKEEAEQKGETAPEVNMF